MPAVTAIWSALDEYLPLLAAGTGIAAETVPLLLLLVYVGVAAGGLLGGPAARLTTRALAGVMALAAVALAAGAISGLPAGFVLIALAFCALQASTVTADARLQDAITGPARATVSSLAGFATELLGVAVFAVYGAGSLIAGDAVLFAGFAAVYLVIAGATLCRAGVHVRSDEER